MSLLQDTGGVGLSTVESLFWNMAQLLWVLEDGEERGLEAAGIS